MNKPPRGPVVLWSLLSALLALIAGWVLGMWATCGPGCGFDVALFDAYGSWVGGLAVPVALFGFTIYTHYTAKRTARDTAFGLALMCTMTAELQQRGDGTFDTVQLEFTNAIGEPVFNPETHVEGGATIRKDRIVASGYKWSHSAKLGAFGVTPSADEKAIREAINAKVRPSIVFVFTIRGYRFARKGAEVYLYDDAPDWRTPKGGDDDGVEDRSVGPSRVSFLRGRAGQRA